MDKKLQIASLLGEIQTLGYMVNEFTEYCVFVNFSGHVGGINVEIAESKANYQKKLLKDYFYLSQKLTDDNKAIQNLSKVKCELRKILRKQNIDYSRLNYTTEVVRHYKLT